LGRESGWLADVRDAQRAFRKTTARSWMFRVNELLRREFTDPSMKRSARAALGASRTDALLSDFLGTPAVGVV
jgi:hypothetical protein